MKRGTSPRADASSTPSTRAYSSAAARVSRPPLRSTFPVSALGTGLGRRRELLDDSKSTDHELVDFQPLDSSATHRQPTNGQRTDGQRPHRQRAEGEGAQGHRAMRLGARRRCGNGARAHRHRLRSVEKAHVEATGMVSEHVSRVPRGQAQFQRPGIATITAKNRPTSTLGTARTMTAIFASFTWAAARSARLPAITAASTQRMSNHRPMLNEETDPSPSPPRKKKTNIDATTTSMAHGIQKLT